MTRKKALSFLVGFLLLCASFPSIIPTAKAQNPQQLWALIICGSTGLSFSNNTQYMYHALTQNYTFNGIYYLDVYTDRLGVNALATKNNVRSAINTTLASWSDNNDIIFIYFTSHGGGYHAANGWELGRVESLSDEGDEVREDNFRILNLNCPNPNGTSPVELGPWPLNTLVDWDDDGNRDDRIRDFDLDYIIEVDVDDDNSTDHEYDYYVDLDSDGNYDDAFLDWFSDDTCDIFIDADPDWVIDGTDTNNDGLIVGVDLTGDGHRDDWVGIDECMEVQDGLYWDDELASDLNTLSYAKLIFVRQGCVEDGEGCFGGGLIDDISAPKRIIMTATDETHHSYGDLDGDGYSEWSEAFIDALHGQRTHYDNGVVHETPPVYVDADTNNNGHVSMWEAWNYAWNHDDARLLGWETPWLDDNGNGLPTYINGSENLDENDGWLASCTYLEPYPWGDNFDDNSIDLTKWEKLEAGEATVAEINQRLEVTVPSGGSGWAQSGLVTKDYYPMQNFSVEIYVAKLDSIHEMTLQIGLTKTTSSDPHDENDWYRILKTRHMADNRLVVQRRVDGNKSNLKEIPWADATGKLQILILDSTIYFYENNILKYSEPYQLSSYDCYIYIFTSTERPDASGTDAFDNFKYDFSVPVHSLMVQTRGGGSEVEGVKVWIDSNPLDYSPVIASVRDGDHTVEVEGIFYRYNYKYIFDHWENSGEDNPRNVTVAQDMTITAHYNVYEQPGGCPFVYTWDGNQYVIDNNLLPTSEASSGVDVEDHYKLEQTPVLENGKYKLLISEFEQEHSYFDRVQLIAVDHESDVNIAVSPYGEILTYKEPSPPVIAVDNNNNDVTSLLEAIDGNYYEGYAGDYLILDFGDLNVQDGAKLVMRADLPPEAEKWTVHIQVLNDTGNWKTVAIVIPRVYWATEIVNLHNYLPDPNGDLKVRLYFTANHKLDYVGLDTSPQEDFQLRYANLVFAVHSTQGDVKLELSESDCVYVELLPGEQIELAFTLPENSKDERTFVIYVKGHYYTIAS